MVLLLLCRPTVQLTRTMVIPNPIRPLAEGMISNGILMIIHLTADMILATLSLRDLLIQLIGKKILTCQVLRKLVKTPNEDEEADLIGATTNN